MSNQQDMYYGNYLQIPSLLNLQHPQSAKLGAEAHDETLFIIVHQVYELWFKQIIHELKSVSAIFSQSFIVEETLSTVVQRLQRVNMIQGLLNEQFAVMETMTPMDFLEFRSLLVPASGFQSVQFREIEIMMGLPQARLGGHQCFLDRLSLPDRQYLEAVGKRPSLLELLEKWLTRTPFLAAKGLSDFSEMARQQEEGFYFWPEYRRVVEDMLQEDRLAIVANSHLDEQQREAQLENLLATTKTFESLFDVQAYAKQRAEGKRYFSQKAMLGVLFISLYREQPLLSMPYQVLRLLMDFDESLSTWRYRHALMAHRMLGAKMGTGGTSGHHYLKMVAGQNRIFTDLFDLASFIIPKSKLPKLPKEIKKNLNFYQMN